MRISKGNFRFFAAAMVSIAAALFSAAILVNAERSVEVVRDQIVFSDSLAVKSYLKNNTLFESDVVESSKIFVNITEKTVLSYSMRVDCSLCSKEGTYSVKSVLKTNDWEKVLREDRGTFSRTLDLEIPLEISSYISLYEKISEELNYKASSPKLILSLLIEAAGKNFSRDVVFNLDSKVVSVDAEKQKKSSFTEKDIVNYVDSNLRILKFALIPLAFLPVACLVYAAKRCEIYEDPFGKYEDIMVKVKSFSGERVELESLKELLKLAEFLNKPLLRSENEIFIENDGVVYAVKIK